MLETIKLVLTQFNDEALAILCLIFLLVFSVLVAYWLYNRKKYRQLIHQIPASVVKNYLDSIIQNSTALKSSLFRGGGLEVGEGIPSVIPMSKLTGGAPVEVSSEILNQKNAEIASLQGRILEKDRIIKDLEAQIGQLSSGASGGDAATALLQGQLKEEKAKVDSLNQKVAELEGDRSELQNRLQEYEIIEDDLANLKKLQIENDELKRKLAGGGGAAPAGVMEAAATGAAAAAVAAPIMAASAENSPIPENMDLGMDMEMGEAQPESESEPVPEPALEAPEMSAGPMNDQALASEEGEAGEGDVKMPPPQGPEKSAEDLLSEFEKMLE